MAITNFLTVERFQFPEPLSRGYVLSLYSHHIIDLALTYMSVLYHQPEKMAKSTQEELSERKANLEALKQQHGIE